MEWRKHERTCLCLSCRGWSKTFLKQCWSIIDQNQNVGPTASGDCCSLNKQRPRWEGGVEWKLNAAEHLIPNSSGVLWSVSSLDDDTRSPVTLGVIFYIAAMAALHNCAATLAGLPRVLSIHSGWGLVLVWYSVWEQPDSSRDVQPHKCTLLS